MILVSPVMAGLGVMEVSTILIILILMVTVEVVIQASRVGTIDLPDHLTGMILGSLQEAVVLTHTPDLDGLGP